MPGAATPEAALEPQVVDSPPEDQPTPAAAEQAPAKPATPVVSDKFNREFTQRSQENAAFKEALGLPRTATIAEVNEAIEALKAGAATPVEDDEALNDPRYLELQRRATEAEWTIARGEYGVEVADAAKDFARFVAKEKAPERVTAYFYELTGRFAPTEEQEAPAAEGADGGPQAPAPADAGLGVNDDESLTARQLDQAAVDEFRGTGNVAGFLAKTGLFRGRES